jgi:hypothetical protein
LCLTFLVKPTFLNPIAKEKISGIKIMITDASMVGVKGDFGS